MVPAHPRRVQYGSYGRPLLTIQNVYISHMSLTYRLRGSLRWDGGPHRLTLGRDDEQSSCRAEIKLQSAQVTAGRLAVEGGSPPGVRFRLGGRTKQARAPRDGARLPLQRQLALAPYRHHLRHTSRVFFDFDTSSCYTAPPGCLQRRAIAPRSPCSSRSASLRIITTPAARPPPSS